MLIRFFSELVRLSFDNGHAVQEIYRAKNRDCRYLVKPIIDKSGVRIHRLKFVEKQSAHVEIPISDSLMEVIKFSRTDNLASP